VIASRRREARAARTQVEAGLDRVNWRWSLTQSRWLDALLVIEEAEA
jgi:hypothetical protein